MSKSIFENKVFSIVPVKGKSQGLYYKGKLISKTSEKYHDDLFEISGNFKNLLNYNAGMVPPDYKLYYLSKPKGFSAWAVLAIVYREDEKVLMDFFFSAETKLLLNADINPLKLLAMAIKLAKKAGYKVDIDSSDFIFDSRCANVYVTVPAGSNLYEHYKTHFDKFRQYFQQAHASIIQNTLESQ